MYVQLFHYCMYYSVREFDVLHPELTEWSSLYQLYYNIAVSLNYS